MKPERLLLFDLEISPIIGAVWKPWEANVVWIERESYVLCFSYKWFGESKTHFVSIRDFPRYKKDPHDDEDVVKVLAQLFDEADLICGQNGDNFDLTFTWGRMFQYHMKPPKPTKTIDTLKLARKYFKKLPYKNLDYMAKALGYSGKTEHEGKDLWRKCMYKDLDGHEQAWKKMRQYNINDVVQLEYVYKEMAPWHVTQPPVFPNALCKSCGSNTVVWKGRKNQRSGRIVRQFRCVCGKWGSIKDE
jgi:hypothetical protein